MINQFKYINLQFLFRLIIGYIFIAASIDKIIDPLINNMSSEEDQYFSIPGHRKISELKTFCNFDVFKQKMFC